MEAIQNLRRKENRKRNVKTIKELKAINRSK